VARKLHHISCGVLRIATVGYNVSIEKPVVVRQDRLSRAIRPMLIDDCRNGR
jgi:hypothetical protein